MGGKCYDRRAAYQRAHEARSKRLRAAREKGTHTRSEWTALADVFGKCVNCGIPYHKLFGGKPTKDHIIPLCTGGCDCIANIQPLCRNCNSRHVGEDLRPIVRPDWSQRLADRLAYGWE